MAPAGGEADAVALEVAEEAEPAVEEGACAVEQGREGRGPSCGRQNSPCRHVTRV